MDDYANVDGDGHSGGGARDGDGDGNGEHDSDRHGYGDVDGNENRNNVVFRHSCWGVDRYDKRMGNWRVSRYRSN